MGSSGADDSATYVNVADYEDLDVLAKIKNVDGVGSGLDADLLDGHDTAYFETPAGAQAKADAKVAETITNGVTGIAPSQDAVFDALALKAPLGSPALTGTPTAPTAAQGTNTTQVATTAYVQTEAGLLIPKTLLDANTVLIATADDTPVALAMGASTILARLASGNIVAATPSQVRTLMSSGCKLVRRSAQTITTATVTTVLFPTEMWDTDGFHDTAANTGDVVIPTGFDGRYDCRGAAVADITALGTRRVGRIHLNGVPVGRQDLVPNSTGVTTATALAELDLVAGDVIRLAFFHDKGSDLDLTVSQSALQDGAGNQICAFLSIQRVA